MILIPYTTNFNVRFTMNKITTAVSTMRTPTIRVPTRSDANGAVQSQKIDRGWKFWIRK